MIRFIINYYLYIINNYKLKYRKWRNQMMSTKFSESTKTIYQGEKKLRLKTKKRDLVSKIFHSEAILKLQKFLIDLIPIFSYRESKQGSFRIDRRCATDGASRACHSKFSIVG